MEKGTARDVTYYISLESETYEHLSNLRTWMQLDMGCEEDTIWLKNLNYDQINSTSVLQIPFVKRYYGKQGKLFPYGRLLPERNIPPLNWQPVGKELALTLPAYNFNYFGESEKFTNKLISSDREKPGAALLTTLPLLVAYLSTAPAVRYQHLEWVLINSEDVLLIGTPFLPIRGTALWQNGDALIPTGFDFTLPAFTNILTRKLVAGKNSWLVWDEGGNYFFINREDLNLLDLAAVRKQKI